MPNSAGYTATEAIAALAIIGLAIGGLQASVQTLARSQEGVVRTTKLSMDVRQLDQAFNGFMAPYGPFRPDRPDRFSGDAARFEFACGGGRCSGAFVGQALVLSSPGGNRRIALNGVHAPSFSYASERSSGPSWPLPISPGQGDRERLRSISVVDVDHERATPVAVARLWKQQEVLCAFDSIRQDCRQQVGS